MSITPSTENEENEVEVTCMLLAEMFLVLRPDLDKVYTLECLKDLFTDIEGLTVDRAIEISYLICAGKSVPWRKN